MGPRFAGTWIMLAVACGGGQGPSDAGDAGDAARDGRVVVMPDAGLRPALCTDDGDCDDGLFCNGAERCDPRASGAGEDGCAAMAAPCPVERCDELVDTCDCDRDGDGALAESCGGLDCDDASPERRPGHAELCDELDNDCDGRTDEAQRNRYCRDADGDGHGSRSSVRLSTECVPPAGFTASCGDCDDTAAAVHPGAVEVCNRRDDDCDGSSGAVEDADGDGHAPVSAPCLDDRPGAFPRDDCDDTRPWVHPGALDFCSSVDEDCDGVPNDAAAGEACRSGTCDDGCRSDHRLALGLESGCAIGSSSEALCWGRLGRASIPGRLVEVYGYRPTAVPGTAGVVQISVSPDDEHACAVRDDGRVLCWGSPLTSGLPPGETAVVPTVSDARQVVCSWQTACARDAAGSVWCWGLVAGALGADYTGTAIDDLVPPRRLPLVGVVELAASWYSVCARTHDGAVHCWGEGPAGDGSDDIVVTEPRRVALPGPADRLTMGGEIRVPGVLQVPHVACARVETAWYCWGLASATLEHEVLESVRLPVRMTTFDLPVELATTGGVSCALDASGSVSCTGSPSGGRLGTVLGATQALTPVSIASVSGASDLVCGPGLCCAERPTGYRCWGYPASLAHGDGIHRDGTRPETVARLSAVTDVGDGCAIENGRVFCWGDQREYRHGQDVFAPALEPLEVPLPPGESFVSVNDSCAVTTGGRVYCWGAHVIGPGARVQVDDSAMGPVSLQRGNCALDMVGQLWCWDPAPYYRERDVVVPERVGGADYSHFDTKGDKTCVVEANGSVSCWGIPSAPWRIEGFQVLEVAVGDGFVCFRGANGGIRCAGSNNNVVLGEYPVAWSDPPVEVVPSGATELRCSDWYCLARVDGAWWGWGSDPYRATELIPNRTRAPAPLPGMAQWQDASPGIIDSCGLRTDGTVECYGGQSGGERRHTQTGRGHPVFSDLIIP